jgi:xylulokinase
MFKSVPDACHDLLRYNDPQPPVGQNSKEYDVYYGLYKSLYPALKDSYQKLASA